MANYQPGQDFIDEVLKELQVLNAQVKTLDPAAQLLISRRDSLIYVCINFGINVEIKPLWPLATK